MPLFGLKNTTEVKSIYKYVVAPVFKPGGGGGYANDQFRDAESIRIGQGATSRGYTLQVVLLSQEDDFGNNINSASNIELDKDVNVQILN